MASPSAGSNKFHPPEMHSGELPVECLSGRMATIKVGKQPVTFNIHEGLLCHYSAFFRAALRGGFKEATSLEVSLQEDDPEIADQAFHWLYSGHITNNWGIFTDMMYDIYDINNEFYDGEIFNLVHLWILGDKVQMPALQNAVMRVLVERVKMVEQNFTFFSSAGLLKHVYANTLRSSPLRRLIIDMALLTGQEDAFSRLMDVEEFPVEIVRDLAKTSFIFMKLAEDGYTLNAYEHLCECWNLYVVGTTVRGEDLFP
ncbi:hypothetical protein SLS58_005465 [Diplodia intermedia]|uniref:BTB domain-containing protein n=1 Tax=Diplodia intermedia TaxID=856260 RepID=A0ABR3TQS0_9PEZI